MNNINSFVITIIQTDHLEDERKTLEGYGTIADKAPGDLKPHSLGLFKEIIEGCLRRYGKRLESNQVSLHKM